MIVNNNLIYRTIVEGIAEVLKKNSNKSTKLLVKKLNMLIQKVT